MHPLFGTLNSRIQLKAQPLLLNSLPCDYLQNWIFLSDINSECSVSQYLPPQRYSMITRLCTIIVVFPKPTLQKKHNYIWFHRVRECVASAILTVQKVDSKFNISYILTKSLPLPLKNSIRQQIIFTRIWDNVTWYNIEDSDKIMLLPFGYVGLFFMVIYA